ncbi:homocysteine S-methyltransferase [bacterium]|nr:homocysteine S-methyltransferase [bacterium]
MLFSRDPFVIVDGGLSTALEVLGHRSQGLLWTAQMLIEQPEVIVAAHRSFVEAGAEVIISASYQASQAGFMRAGCSVTEARQLLASTTALARASGAGMVAASVGPFGATLGDGSEYHGRYEASWSQVRRFHRERLEILVDTGPDLLAIETIPGHIEAEIILEELEVLGGPPTWLSFSCRDAASTCAGDSFVEVVRSLSGNHTLLALGVNCTDPNHVTPLLNSAARQTDRPWVVYPNHGQVWDPILEDWAGQGCAQLVPHLSDWLALGARFIGGCCGIGPDQIRQLKEARGCLRLFDPDPVGRTGELPCDSKLPTQIFLRTPLS